MPATLPPFIMAEILKGYVCNVCGRPFTSPTWLLSHKDINNHHVQIKAKKKVKVKAKIIPAMDIDIGDVQYVDTHMLKKKVKVVQVVKQKVKVKVKL